MGNIIIITKLYITSNIIGIFILGWAVVLRFTTSNSPAKAKCMTNTERTYLEHSLENHRPINKEPHRVPWKEMVCLFN